MADLVRNDQVPAEPVTEPKAEHSTDVKQVELDKPKQVAPNIQVMRGNVDVIAIKLLEAINNNLVAILSELRKENG
jgi:hypothetical protein